MVDTLNYSCRLCLSSNNFSFIDGKDERKYFLCNICKIITAHPNQFLNREDEKKHYQTHQNGIQFDGYVNFLMKAINPVLQLLSKGMIGLDYGCGHTPTLSLILKEYGFICEDYDPIFINKKLNKKYDFIFSTEVFEHFFYPANEIKKLSELLKKNGLLIIMTEQWTTKEFFSKWYYTRDPSHVSFYSKETFDFICRNFGFTKIFDDNKRVVILSKF